jgi:hypothetical protein
MRLANHIATIISSDGGDNNIFVMKERQLFSHIWVLRNQVSRIRLHKVGKTLLRSQFVIFSK